MLKRTPTAEGLTNSRGGFPMLSLERADLLQLEPISHRGTLKLLPVGKKHKVLGDSWLRIHWLI